MNKKHKDIIIFSVFIGINILLCGFSFGSRELCSMRYHNETIGVRRVQDSSMLKGYCVALESKNLEEGSFYLRQNSFLGSGGGLLLAVLFDNRDFIDMWIDLGEEYLGLGEASLKATSKQLDGVKGQVDRLIASLRKNERSKMHYFERLKKNILYIKGKGVGGFDLLLNDMASRFFYRINCVDFLSFLREQGFTFVNNDLLDDEDMFPPENKCKENLLELIRSGALKNNYEKAVLIARTEDEDFLNALFKYGIDYENSEMKMGYVFHDLDQIEFLDANGFFDNFKHADLGDVIVGGSFVAFKYFLNKLGVLEDIFEDEGDIETINILSLAGIKNLEIIDFLIKGVDFSKQDDSGRFVVLEHLLLSGSVDLVRWWMNSEFYDSSLLLLGQHHREGLIISPSRDGKAEWASRLSTFLSKYVKGYVVNLSQAISLDDAILSKLHGFFCPGSFDMYPERQFKLVDIQKKMDVDTVVNQKLISYSIEHDKPYLGFCAGAQHLVLNRGGSLSPVSGHLYKIVNMKFVKTTLPYLLAMTEEEQILALNFCHLEDIENKYTNVQHNYAGVEGILGERVALGGLSDAGVVEAVSHGVHQVGFQFHPEYVYDREDVAVLDSKGINRNKVVLDGFVKILRTHKRAYDLAVGTGVKEILHDSRQVMLDRLVECVEQGENARPLEELNFWGSGMGSYEVKKVNNATFWMLPDVMPEDIEVDVQNVARGDLILRNKVTGEALTFKVNSLTGEVPVESIQFANGEVLSVSGYVSD